MTACLIQGDIRNGTSEVVDKMLKHFDIVILSTWIGSDISKINSKCKVLLNQFPENFGLSNRNLQRFSTARGIDFAMSLNCNIICKWRSDMLPLCQNFDIFFKKLNFLNSEDNSQYKILFCPFRCLTSSPDWFSSIPDLFAFGSIDQMKMLWGDDDFDYTKSYNIPIDLKDSGIIYDNFEKNWSPETELYAFYKSRLQRKLKHQLSHAVILKNYCELVDHHDFDIIWFGKTGYRSIFQAFEHPWWTLKVWKGQQDIIVARVDRKLTFIERIKSIISIFMVQQNILKQNVKFRKYLNGSK